MTDSSRAQALPSNFAPSLSLTLPYRGRRGDLERGGRGHRGRGYGHQPRPREESGAMEDASRVRHMIRRRTCGAAFLSGARVRDVRPGSRKTCAEQGWIIHRPW